MEGKTRSKSEMCRELQIDVLIDDNPRYATEVANANIQAFLFDWKGEYPWSKMKNGDRRDDIVVRVGVLVLGCDWMCMASPDDDTNVHIMGQAGRPGLGGCGALPQRDAHFIKDMKSDNGSTSARQFSGEDSASAEDAREQRAKQLMFDYRRNDRHHHHHHCLCHDTHRSKT